MSQTTSIQFSFYDVAQYILTEGADIKLNEINRSLLFLFNNDLWMHSRLDGKFKGLWWRSWYDGKFAGAYDQGDIVTANGIEEIRFLRDNWKSVQRIANYNVVGDELVNFDINNNEVVGRYLDALADNFFLGDKYEDQQLYLSLSSKNKERPTNGAQWQPYLVTATELGKRTYLLEDLFRDAIAVHETAYHTGLDILDAADYAYESGKAAKSIYEAELLKYLPTAGLLAQDRLDAESSDWIAFLGTETGMKLHAMGLVAHDFLHIFKPLGDDIHRIETLVGMDGKVTVSGYVPTAIMSEVVPEKGTQEYNQWKNGGMRKYALRLDYPINNAYSKLFFKKLKEDTTAAIAPRTPSQDLRVSRGIGSKNISDSDDFTDLNDQIDKLQEQVDTIKTQIDMGNVQDEDSIEFPLSTDAWAKSASMKVAEGSILSSQLEATMLKTKDVPILFNPEVVGQTRQQSQDSNNATNRNKPIIDPAYKQSSSVETLVNPCTLINVSGTTENEYWTVASDTAIYDPQEKKPRRVIVFSMNMDADKMKKLIYPNSTTRALVSSKDGSLGALLDECDSTGIKFQTLELEQTKVEYTGQITVEKSQTQIGNMVNIDASAYTADAIRANPNILNNLKNSVMNSNGTPKKLSASEVSSTVTENGTISVTYQRFKRIEASVTLREYPEDDVVRAEDILDGVREQTDSMLEDTQAHLDRAYDIVANTETMAIVLFFPSVCHDSQGRPITDLRDIARSTAQEQTPGDFDLIADLFRKFDVKITTSEDEGSEPLMTYMFTKPAEKADVPEQEQTKPLNLVDGVDPSVVASNMRLIRNFGTFRSPAMIRITDVDVQPRPAALLSPADGNATAYVTEWHFSRGQLAMFYVPSNCTDIAFKISGVARMSEVEPRDTTIYDFEETVAENKTGIRWLWHVVDCQHSIDLVRAAIDCGIPIPSSVDLALIENISDMLNRLNKCMVEQRYFPRLVELRFLPITDLKALADKLRSFTVFQVQNETFTAVSELIDKSYDYLYSYLQDQFRFDWIYELYGYSADEYNLDEPKPMVRRILFKREIIRNITRETREQTTEFNNYLSAMRTWILVAVNEGEVATKEMLSRLLEAVSEKREKRDAMLDVLEADNCDAENDQGKIAYLEVEPGKSAFAELRQEFLEGDQEEITTYVNETEKAIETAVSVDTELSSYLTMEGLSTETYATVIQRLLYLKDFANRFSRSNLCVAKGYEKYLLRRKWINRLPQENIQTVLNKLATLKEHLAALPGRLKY